MLTELRVQDFAIIEDLMLEFGPGLTVFTGETGAGKSIIIDAVEMVLGGRAEAVNVRTGSGRALIEGTFRVAGLVDEQIQAVLDREELIEDSEFLSLSREIRREGRNVCRVNGRVVPLTVLREIGEWLVDVHGQSEHLSLLRIPEHIHLLDRFAHVGDLASEYRGEFQALTSAKDELQSLRVAEQDSAQRADLLAYQINEIESAKLDEGEKETLVEERNRLTNAERLAEYAHQAIQALDDGLDEGTSATELLGRVLTALTGLSKLDPSSEREVQSATELVEASVDLDHRLRVYLESIEFSPERLEEVEERLEMIHALQRKYGTDYTEIIAFAERAREELKGITHAEERILELEREVENQTRRLAEIGLTLSQRRLSASNQLSEDISRELSDLKMDGAKFDVAHEWYQDESGVSIEGRNVALRPNGLDRIEFLVAPNPGEGLKPLAKIASGGETTRLMLGLKGVLAQADQTPTLIFDEIDQGIGGRVGAIVGQKLWHLARDHQVLCITHLPQLAAYGDHHFHVTKIVEAGRTHTDAQRLDSSDRLRELALMLGGETEPNRRSAEQLLQQATQINAHV